MPHRNQLLEKLKAGRVVLGTWSEIASPMVANVIATTGMDFIIIDMEHGPVSLETCESMIRAAEVDGCWPIIRVTENREPIILRALELSSQAILIPHVENVKQAKAAVAASRYYPEGERGLGPYTRNHNYSQDHLNRTIPETNRETFVGILVEGKEGIASLSEIASVKGLDLIYLGIYDISQAVGLPGQLRHSTVLKAIERSIKILKSKGIAAGSYAPDLDYAKKLIQLGFQFIAYSVDIAAIQKHYQNVKQELGMIRK